MPPSEVLQRRLATQRLTAGPVADPVQATGVLTRMNATRARAARYGAALRSAANTEAAVQSAIDAGVLVYSQTSQPVWHLIRHEDVRWLAELTAPGVERLLVKRVRNLRMDPAYVGQRFYAIAHLLAGHRALTRKAIGVGLQDLELPTKPRQLDLVLMMAGLRGMVCAGPPRVHDRTWVLLDDVATADPQLDREGTLRKAAERYFAGHGPASLTDFASWATLSIKEAGVGIRAADTTLTGVDVDGLPHWFIDQGAVPARGRPAILIPADDEILNHYTAGTLPWAPDHPLGPLPHVPGSEALGQVLWQGQLIGAWRALDLPDRAALGLWLAPSATSEQRSQARDAAVDCAEFIQQDVEVLEHFVPLFN